MENGNEKWKLKWKLKWKMENRRGKSTYLMVHKTSKWQNTSLLQLESDMELTPYCFGYISC